MTEDKIDSEFDAEKDSKIKHEIKRLPLASGVFSIFSRFSHIGQRLVDSWHKLHGNQKIYLLAVAAFFINVGEASKEVESQGVLSDSMLIVGCIALFAMARELWSIFTSIWDSTFGKSVVVVMYAIIANFTLAIASQKINTIVGVAPSRLIYTQGLTTLVLLPFWILLLSLLAMTFIFIAAQLKAFVFGLLNWLHIHRTPQKKKEHLPGLFFIIRVIFLPVVMMTLAHALQWYGEKVHLGNMAIGLTETENQSSNEEVEEKSVVFSVSDTEGAVQTDTELTTPKTDIDIEPAIAASPAKKGNTENQEEGQKGIFNGEIGEVDKAIARFVYNFETFSGSRCILAPGERAVPINENDILVVIKDESSELGYRFSSRPCEVKGKPITETLAKEANTK